MLRRTLAAQVCVPTVGSALSAAIDAFAEHAVARSLPPERMLVALKAACRDVPSLRPAPPGSPQAVLLDLVVTRSIESYFRPVPLELGRGA